MPSPGIFQAPVNLVEERRNFLDLVNHNQVRPAGQYLLAEQPRAQEQRGLQVPLEKVHKLGGGELLPQQSGFADLTGSPEESGIMLSQIDAQASRKSR